jgi:hypothetical protein
MLPYVPAEQKDKAIRVLPRDCLRVGNLPHLRYRTCRGIDAQGCPYRGSEGAAEHDVVAVFFLGTDFTEALGEDMFLHKVGATPNFLLDEQPGKETDPGGALFFQTNLA